MKYNKFLVSLIIITTISLTLSFFACILSYGAYIEVKRISSYIQLPIPEYTPSTAVFSTPFTGAFVLVASSISLLLIFSILIILLIFVFRK